MKDTGAELLESNKIYTDEAVRAIDNIAPEPIPSLRVLDTPNDAGGSITVTWVKSESDLMISRSFAGAVGPSTADAIPGVKGYNIYRSMGDEPAALVGKVGPGETSFVDLTAFNGVRYTYQVTPYDDDNETTSELERTAMAIRNHVVDKNGKAVYGLFGMDNRVETKLPQGGGADYAVRLVAEVADRLGATAVSSLNAAGETCAALLEYCREHQIVYNGYSVSYTHLTLPTILLV